MSLNFKNLRQENPLVADVLELALKASAAILDVYEKGCDVDNKADGSPVTIADQLAETIIHDGLKKLFPDVPVVAEEAVEAGQMPKCGQRYFLVDPLDGTREFVSRNGEFTVNIALVDAGEPVFGVVIAPALGDVFWGGQLAVGQSETRAFAGKIDGLTVAEIEEISVGAAAEDGLTVLASRSHLSPETEVLIEKLNVKDRVSVGSSLKLCWLAAGKADVYPRLGPTMQWDIAAGDAVLRAAGGKTVQLEGCTPFTYELPETAEKADLLNPHFVAMGDPRILDQLR